MEWKMTSPRSLRFHLENEIKKNIGAGVSPEEARYAALRSFGGVDRVKEGCRDVRGMRFLEELWQDVRYGLRVLLKNPGFASVAVLTLALGIGVNSAMFSVASAVLIRPLPFKAADRLFWITEFYPRSKASYVLAPDFIGWRQQSQVFEELAAYGSGISPFVNLVIPNGGDPERVSNASVSANLFSLLDIRPSQGRAFLPEEDRPGAEPVALLSHALWQRRFGADPAAIGKTVVLDGRPFTVVGVLPASFWFPAEVQGEVFTPIGLPSESFWDERTLYLLKVIGRLKPAVSPEQAVSDLSAISKRLTAGYPRGQAHIRSAMQVRIMPLHRKLLGDAQPALLVLAVAVGLVLLIACSNVANLQLSRAVTRQREIAVRAALGASRSRLVRQLTVESVLLAGIGAGVGLLLAYGCMSLFRAISADALGLSYGLFIDRIGLDWRVLTFSAGIAVVAGVLSALAPALFISKVDLNDNLKDASSRSSGGQRQHLLRGFLVISQLALTLALLVGWGLLIRSLMRLTDVDPGFRTSNVFTAQIELPDVGYSDSAEIGRFFQQLLRKIREVPAIDFAEATSDLPLMGFFSRVSVQFEGEPLPTAGQIPLVPFRRVSPGCFQAMGIPLISGRQFTDFDNGRVPVAIVNQSFAQAYHSDGTVLGKFVYLGRPTPTEIVGIVRDVRHEGLHAAPSPEIFVPYQQDPHPLMTLVIRSNLDPNTLRTAIQQQVLSLDKGLAIYNAATLVDRLRSSLLPRRTNLLLLGIFTGLAFTLALTGIYGVIAYSVSQRTQEIGVRMALGARRNDVLALVMSQGAKLILAGLLTGLATALAFTRLLAGQVYGITTHDPLTLAGAAVVLGVVALLACYLPARRATQTDPVVALRCE
jgi:predicted permease